ncbi:MAG: hypothetical protein JST58_16930 [Bacteroidetes bacterium]|nr:hypothetical protein [Bacteroidota bacterium]
MNPIVTKEIGEVMDAVHFNPELSLIIPFEPKMSKKAEMEYALKIALDKVERQLRERYSNEMGDLVIHKLRNIIKNLNYHTHKKSIAIYVSPVFEKILYLDLLVEEKIIIDGRFEIRDLIYCKKQVHKYLVLLLSNKEFKIFIGNTETFVRVLANTSESVYAYINEAPEKVANFSDTGERKEIVMEKFLHHIDDSLGHILNSYHLPVFVLGTKRIVGHFLKLTKYANKIVETVHGNYEEASIDELKNVLLPFVLDWKTLLQKNILNQLDEANDKNKLAVGMKEVWEAAMSQRGHLLVVEKNFMYPIQDENGNDPISWGDKPYYKFSYVKDAVDAIIEKVLANGGDIEFMDEGALSSYSRIALIKFF